MAKAMEIQDETTCGKGLAANSWLPAKELLQKAVEEDQNMLAQMRGA
jgi:hypothetical protein